jgi:dihydrodipicolinate reductase
MHQLSPLQLQEFTDLIENNQLDQAELLLIEQLNLSPTASKNLVKILSQSSQAMQSFQANPQVVFADDPEFNKKIKSTESKSFEFNFSSTQVKITDKDGKMIEVNDQHPDWQEIKKQFNIDLTEPDALTKFAESFMQEQHQNAAPQTSFKQNDSTTVHDSALKMTGVEDLSHQNKSSSIWLLIGLLVLIGIAAFYYFKL